MLLFLTTSMAAVTSLANQQYVLVIIFTAKTFYMIDDFLVSETVILGKKKIPSTPSRSGTYDFPATSPDAHVTNILRNAYCTGHLCCRNSHAAKTKTLFSLFLQFRRNFASFFGQTTRKGFQPSRQKVSFWISFQEHKSMKSVREQSILAFPMAKFGPLMEPIRMLLFTMDQFSRIINSNRNVGL